MKFRRTSVMLCFFVLAALLAPPLMADAAPGAAAPVDPGSADVTLQPDAHSGRRVAPGARRPVTGHKSVQRPAPSATESAPVPDRPAPAASQSAPAAHQPPSASQGPAVRRPAPGATRRTSAPTGVNTVGGAYHGNAETKIYHNSTCRYFNCRKCTVPFASPAEARGAGFVACKRCGG